MDAKTGEMGCPADRPTTVRSLLGRTNRDWWPELLPLDILHQGGVTPDPMGEDFNYAEAFEKLDYQALKRDLTALMTDSQPWWPADYGNYGPFFIRMAWHAAGTYRTGDGRGGANSGNQRFAPLNSWPDNGNLDKARRLLWPIKRKYGKTISWADLFILAGNVAIESMGGPIFGFGGGRKDIYEAERDVYWGAEEKWVSEGAETRHQPERERELENPLAAVQMGLIYVNPEGPGGNPDPLQSARDIKITFERMAMNHEETVALTAGGHTFGKAHGAGDPSMVDVAPEGADITLQGLGWASGHESGFGEHTITSGIEGSWVNTPTQWSENYFRLLLDYEYELVRSPAGAQQWQPINQKPEDMAPAAHDPSKRVPTMMTTADMALREDPEFRKISERFRNDHEAFKDAFARAWFKLTHRDMGPKVRYLGPEVPEENLHLAGPGPGRRNAVRCRCLRVPVENPRCRVEHRPTGQDRLGGGVDVSPVGPSRRRQRRAHHARSAEGLGRQRAGGAGRTLAKIDELRGPLSMADAIVLAGTAAVEKAAREAGFRVEVPFTGGRGDATQDWTDVESFSVLEPAADGFRNYLKTKHSVRTEELLIDRAQLLGLSAPEMTVLLGGLRVLGANYKDRPEGVFTARKGQLTNDFFVNLLDNDTMWEVIDESGDEEFIGYDRGGRQEKWRATRTDLIFGSNSQLRATAEVYAERGNEEKFVRDFIKAWTKVMNADRFDLPQAHKPAEPVGIAEPEMAE